MLCVHLPNENQGPGTGEIQAVQGIGGKPDWKDVRGPYTCHKTVLKSTKYDCSKVCSDGVRRLCVADADTRPNERCVRVTSLIICKLDTSLYSASCRC